MMLSEFKRTLKSNRHGFLFFQRKSLLSQSYKKRLVNRLKYILRHFIDFSLVLQRMHFSQLTEIHPEAFFGFRLVLQRMHFSQLTEIHPDAFLGLRLVLQRMHFSKLTEIHPDAFLGH